MLVIVQVRHKKSHRSIYRHCRAIQRQVQKKRVTRIQFFGRSRKNLKSTSSRVLSVSLRDSADFEESLVRAAGSDRWVSHFFNSSHKILLTRETSDGDDRSLSRSSKYSRKNSDSDKVMEKLQGLLALRNLLGRLLMGRAPSVSPATIFSCYETSQNPNSAVRGTRYLRAQGHESREVGLRWINNGDSSQSQLLFYWGSSIIRFFCQLLFWNLRICWTSLQSGEFRTFFHFTEGHLW